MMEGMSNLPDRIEISDAASLLGIGRRRFLQLAKQHGLSVTYERRRAMTTVEVALYNSEDVRRLQDARRKEAE